MAAPLVAVSRAVVVEAELEVVSVVVGTLPRFKYQACQSRAA
jgi:hypothetical protein